MWLDFFEQYNGISVFHDRFWVSNADVELYTDAAASIGFGCYYKGHWCHGTWPAVWQTSGITADITVLELFPILVAISIWGRELRNKKIVFHCDNQAVVHIVNTMSSKSENVMKLVRATTLHCLEFNLAIKGEHVAGSHNLICDSLSRAQVEKFRELAPEADDKPQPIPSHLWNIFM